MIERLKCILAFLLLCGALKAADTPKKESLTLTEVTALQAIIQQQQQIAKEICTSHGIDLQSCVIDPDSRTVSQKSNDKPKQN